MKFNDISLLPISVLVVLLISASSTNFSSTSSFGLVSAAPHAQPPPAVATFKKTLHRRQGYVAEVVSSGPSDFEQDENESAAPKHPSPAAPTGRKHMSSHEERVAEVVEADEDESAARKRPSPAAPTGRKHMSSHEERVAEVVEADEDESVARKRPSPAAPTGRKHMSSHKERVAEVVVE